MLRFSQVLFITLIISLLTIGTSAGQNVAGQDVQRITFDEAIRIGLSQNISLKKAKNSVEQQGMSVQAARASYLPNLNLSTGGGQNYGLSFDNTSGRLLNETSESFNLNASTSINLFNGFQDQSGVKQANRNLDAASFNLDRTRQNVVLLVAQQFLQIIQDREQIKIQTQNLDAQNEQLAQIKGLVAAGARSISEEYQQESTVAQGELTLIRAESSYQLSQVRLIKILELDPFGRYEFAAPTIDQVNVSPINLQLEMLLKQAFDNRTDLRAQNSVIQANKQGLSAARGAFLPTVSLSAGYGTNYSSQRLQLTGEVDPVTNRPLTEETPFGTQFSDNRGGNIRLNVSIPIFNRLQVKNNVERNEIALRNARLDLENLQQDVALEVRQAYLDYQTAQKELESSNKQVTFAAKALEVQQERYNVGAGTLVELTNARSTFVQAASNKASAIYKLLVQKEVIDYYVGVIDPSRSIFE